MAAGSGNACGAHNLTHARTCGPAMAMTLLRSSPQHSRVIGIDFQPTVDSLRAQFGKLILVAGWAHTDAHQELRNRIWRTLHEENSQMIRHYMALCAFSPGFVNHTPPAMLEPAIAANQDLMVPPHHNHQRVEVTRDVMKKYEQHLRTQADGSGAWYNQHPHRAMARIRLRVPRRNGRHRPGRFPHRPLAL